ncbi:MAG: glycosyltransferase [Bacteroidetes bacterium]|nr:glycosyltransferase [Bacteroidota bacterium]
MNLLFLNSAKVWGGNERWMAQTIRKLSESHSVFLAARRKGIGDRFQIPVFELPFLSEADILTLSRLVSLIHRHQIDVLLPTKRKDYVLAGLAARMTGRVSVIRLGIARQPKAGIFHRLVYDFLADGIIVNAESIRKELLEISYMKPEKIRVIYNGIDYLEVRMLAAEPAPSLPAGRFRIVSSGELSARKGHDLAIAGFSRFLTETPEAADEASLIIVGGGPDEKRLRASADATGFGHRIHFTGFLKNPYPVIASGQVFLMMSASEGISNALLEAMVLNLPVITTSGAGGAAEFLEHGVTGWLLGENPADEAAVYLSRLYSDEPKRQDTAREGCEKVLSFFDLNRMKQDLDEFLSECRRHRK